MTWIVSPSPGNVTGAAHWTERGDVPVWVCSTTASSVSSAQAEAVSTDSRVAAISMRRAVDRPAIESLCSSGSTDSTRSLRSAPRIAQTGERAGNRAQRAREPQSIPQTVIDVVTGERCSRARGRGDDIWVATHARPRRSNAEPPRSRMRRR